ncbi:MAG: hypothetical protein IT385_29295 [Deltaproteobacteria bacterium]|nr:hypothetical protein [Deltaproteobacteria bacterium]
MTRSAILILACALSASASLAPDLVGAAEPRPPEQGDTPGAGRGKDGKGRRERDDGRSGTGGTGEGSERRARRDIEGGGGGTRSAEELMRDQPMLEIDWRAGGCGIDGHTRFVAALLSLENRSDLMSLEIWGDAHEYVPYQRVYYYMRVPRAAYVTMFWIGPEKDIFVPFQNLRIPGDRDVKVDPDSIVVPPLGREQWVAVATLEPLPLSCWSTDEGHVAWVQKVKQLPHGVGRWEVRSKTR